MGAISAVFETHIISEIGRERAKHICGLHRGQQKPDELWVQSSKTFQDKHKFE